MQLPPNFKFDAPLLEDFLALRPPAFSFAFEVRHASWYTEETYDVLRRHQTALCLVRDRQAGTAGAGHSADFAYVRLRLEEYTRNSWEHGGPDSTNGKLKASMCTPTASTRTRARERSTHNRF